MSEKRVLVLATTFPRWFPDSEPPFVWELTRRLAKSGYTMDVLVPHAPGALTYEVREDVSIHRFRYAPKFFEKVCYEGGALPNLRHSWRARIGLPSLLYCQRKIIHRMISKTHYSLVHSHWVIPQGYWAADICRRMNIPLLVTAHAGDVFGLKGLLRRAARHVLSSASLVTANSKATAEALHQILPTCDPKIIPMGVDLDTFTPTSTFDKKLNGSPALLAAGRFAEKKGFHILLSALPRVLKTCPEAHLHLVGFGPEEEHLRQMIIRLGIGEQVSLHGAVPHTEMKEYYQRADLFIQPSIEAVHMIMN